MVKYILADYYDGKISIISTHDSHEEAVLAMKADYESFNEAENASDFWLESSSAWSSGKNDENPCLWQVLTYPENRM